MAIQIAHLSDLHFGSRFDIHLWQAVKAEVIGFDPDIIVVSGDMVDSPVPIQLLAAKCELRTFARDAKAELVVVPGNHDVFAKGLHHRLIRRTTWFERIFFADTARAEVRAAQEFGAPPGFTKLYMRPRRRRAAMLAKCFSMGKSFEALLPPPKRQDLVWRPESHSILFARLDSNKPGSAVGLATGWVDEADLSALRGDLGKIKGSHLARVAVVHHHLLPIAFSSKPTLQSEPLMVLHNAGTVLAILSEHHFDVVLHGHWHIPQFARVDLMPINAPGYPVAVVSGGSAALRSDTDARANAINFVTISDNGRIEVQCLQYGSGRAPNRETAKIYRESTEVTKGRAHSRARERHTLECHVRTQTFEVTETGDLVVEDRLEGLRTRDANHPGCRDHIVALPSDGFFVSNQLALLRDLPAMGCTLVPVPSSQGMTRAPSRVRIHVTFPRDRLRRDGVAYGVRYACGNSVNMTRWESEERTQHDFKKRIDDWDVGWVSGGVAHPTEELRMSLKLPPGLGDARPFLRCWRPRDYPDYVVNTAGEVDVGDLPSVEDSDMAEQERPALRYDFKEGQWQLRIAHPLVGYRYQIVWAMPEDRPDGRVRGQVLERRRVLLRAADDESWPGPAVAAFDKLAAGICKLLGSGLRDEKNSIGLFVYDSAKVGLRPVLSRRSWTQARMRSDFVIPLGQGIAGAAFRQRRLLPWAETDSPFIASFPYDGEDDKTNVSLRTMLGMPIYHESHVNDDQPPPWSCIGVVSFGSSSDASLVPRLVARQRDEEAGERVTRARLLAQLAVEGLLKSLEEGDDQTPHQG